MDTKRINYQEEKKVYYKVLVGLLLLTAVTFIQPHMFMTHSTFLAQMLIAVVKAYLIVIYYMHLKGEKLITAMVWFALALVTVFFIIVIGIDVSNFQFGAESHITAPAAH
ncbi:cytochrome C oxidase subunit IV family protein [Sulfurovum sp.]|uniref:cytochrome C oxidase subunit IV family protein n=1 Tax=Sulfurovum sp. TaxID=1969726 RepID=UPI003562733F